MDINYLVCTSALFQAITQLMDFEPKMLIKSAGIRVRSLLLVILTHNELKKNAQLTELCTFFV